MKMKFYAIGLVSVAALGLCVSEAAAWFWNGCCNRCCSTYICCRPYNAFTPVCFGNVTCDGCCPLQGAGWGWNGGMAGPASDMGCQSGAPMQVPSDYVPPAPLPVTYGYPQQPQVMPAGYPTYYPQNPANHWTGGYAPNYWYGR